MNILISYSDRFQLLSSMKLHLLFVFFSLSGSLFAQTNNDPVLMTINQTPIHKSEFEYIYNKNNSQNAIDKKTLAEYLILFENFKMKVLEAEAQGMDTTKAFIDELSGYRKQLTPPYLTDTATQNRLEKEAYDRLKEDVDVSHILIRVASNATPSDTLAAYDKILGIRDRVTKGKTIVPKCGFFAKLFGKCHSHVIAPENFNEVAKTVSQDPSVSQNSGHLGYITGFMTIYPFETVAYNTPVGQVSAPVRTPYGYHLIKVEGRRPTRGQVQVAHIMKFAQKGVSDTVIAKMKHKIDSAYQLVKSGADFAAVARQISDDRGSASNGGLLPWFGTSYMVKEFEDVAFSLKKGEISEPFLSPYGWHIIKLIDTKPIESFAEKKAEIERRIQRDERANIITQSFVEKLKTAYHFKATETGLSDFYQLAEKHAVKDSLFKIEASKLNGSMASFDDKSLSQKEFAAFLAKYPNSQKTNQREILDEKYAQFITSSLIAYKDKQLEKEYPEFGNLVHEYHDGILLFNISNQEVWDKATKDTKGLDVYFKANRNNYAWAEPHFKGTVIYCKNQATLHKVQELLKTAPKDSIASFLTSKLAKDSLSNIKIEKGIYAKGDNKAVDQIEFKSGIFASKEFPFVFTSGRLLKTGPEDYEDVRGVVTSDYQGYLEAQWIKELRRKYSIKIDQKVLKTVKEN